ncbi:YgjV family protein [Pseudovibrio sp. Tun.PSC04-5.I4]|uniref:YgjV family protein n=1 Tax=Pseudovibrio sp. Tun.PSC04-5.I4 TaxID=1798213 RepID=UPI0008822327|nr:YgjV family protein [Pseudovibrio sp. Tun.PSC04-5.I4]SDQ11880.1 inner membrane protein [Pseudovibrio sp. Tun.PSC04-5.I4]SDQ24844.1 inner membrane protein [Pseudovibrio sp. Tun.PSC04-5.I4]
MDLYIIQALGITAFAVNMVGFSTSRDQLLRSLIFLSASLFCIHYVLLGAYVAGLSLALSGLRSLISLKYKGNRWFFGFAIVQTLMSLAIYDSPFDLLPWSASLLNGYAMFCLSGIRMRVVMLVGAALWCSNAVIVGSWGGAINDLTNGTLLLVTIYRMKTATNKEVLNQA